MSNALAALWFLMGTAWGQAVPLPAPLPVPTSPPASPPVVNVQPRDIEQAILDLGHPQFEVRERASLWLWKVGRPAEDAVARAVSSRDLEVRTRARHLHELMRFGIYADAPPEVVSHVRQFITGDRNVRQQSWGQLTRLAAYEPMIRLLPLEQDETLRRQLYGSVAEALKRAVGGYLERGEVERVGPLLEMGLEFSGTGQSAAVRNYVAYLVLTGQVQPEFDKITANDRTTLKPVQLTKLGYLLRVQGQLAEARELAERENDRALLADVCLRQQDWERLLRLKLLPGDKGGVEEIGFTAAAHRLLENEAGVREELAKLDLHIKTAPGRYWMHTKVLMINDRWEAASDVYATHSPQSMFDLLAQRGLYREAFGRLGIEHIAEASHLWFGDKLKEVADKPLELASLVRLGLKMAEVLARLGEREAARLMLGEVQKVIFQAHGSCWSALPETELKLGYHQAAYLHAGEMIRAIGKTNLHEISSPEVLVRNLFPKPQGMAVAWWRYLLAKYPQETPASCLQRLHEIMQGRHLQLAVPETAQPLLQEVEQTLFGFHLKTLNENTPRPADNARLGNVPMAELIRGLAETCKLYRHVRLEFEYRKAIDHYQSTVDSLLLMGDLHAELSEWHSAALAYQLARAKADSPLAIYLQGWALTKAGSREEGTRLMRLARILPLGDAAQRQRLADGLAERKFAEEALEQRRLIMLLGPFESWDGMEGWAINQTAQHIGNALSKKEPLASAAAWERLQLSALMPSISFTELQHYAMLSHLIHRNRALGLLETGQLEKARQEAWRGHDVLPLNSEFIIDLVTAWDNRQTRDEADRLFDSGFQKLEQVCTQFPRGAQHHNNLAWMAARCHRRLDAALAHGLIATALEPDRPGYWDTLAEVYFSRGETTLAVETIDKALELDPTNEFYQKQKERFTNPPAAEQAPPASPASKSP